MLAKIAAALLAVVVCEGQQEAAGELRGPPDACRVQDYSCYPLDRLANSTCAHACEQPAHCHDYSRDEYRFCASHPGVGGAKRCTPDGLPSWISHCAPGL